MTAHARSSSSARVRFADPHAIGECVSRYAAALRTEHPEIRSIRWFGSWVNGTAGVGSDVDLCITIDRSLKAPRERIPDYLPVSFPVGIDLFVYTEGEMERLQADHPAFHETLLAGRLV